MAKTQQPALTEEQISRMNIFSKLSQLRGMVDVMQKNRRGGKGNYVSADEILAKVKGGMDNLHLVLYPQIVPNSFKSEALIYEKKDYDKTGQGTLKTVREHLVEGEIDYTWVNLDDPSDKLTVPWRFIGQQDNSSQALGSALTYAERYFLLKFFQVATVEDDPDEWVDKKKAAEEENDRAAVEAIAGEIDRLIASHIDPIEDAETKDAERTRLSEVIKKHAVNENGRPTANYRKIADPQTAAAVLEAVRKEISSK